MSSTVFDYKATETCFVAWLGQVTCLDLALNKLGICVDWSTSVSQVDVGDWCLHVGTDACMMGNDACKMGTGSCMMGTDACMLGTGACMMQTNACIMMMMMLGTSACRPPYQCLPQQFSP